MDMLLKGALLGFSIAAPVGPIGVLCIRRTLAGGRWVGFASGLGAAVADTLYGGVAAFGLTAVSGFLVQQQVWLHLIGGLFLLYMGLKTFTAQPADRAAGKGPRKGSGPSGPLRGPLAATGGGAAGAFWSTFALTITNPMTILSFAAVFAGLGLAQAGGPIQAGLMVVGIFTGSAAWWLLLATGTSLLGPQVDATVMRRINRVSGVLILLFAVAAFATMGGS